MDRIPSIVCSRSQQKHAPSPTKTRHGRKQGNGGTHELRRRSTATDFRSRQGEEPGGFFCLARDTGDRPLRLVRRPIPVSGRMGRSCRSQRIRRPQRVRLVLVAQLLLGGVPKLFLAAFGPAGLLPQAMRAFSDLLLGRLGQLHLLLWKHGPTLGVRGAWRRGRAGQPSAATLARGVKLRPCARVPARPPPGSRCPSGHPHPAKVTGTTPCRGSQKLAGETNPSGPFFRTKPWG